jgi:nucleoside-diphosphate-sugar epimerase
VIALRQFNCIGERETHPYVVPEIINQLAEQRADYVAEVDLGNNSFRDFLYAGDAVAMAVELLEKGNFGEVYNMGSEYGIKIYELAKNIGRLMGFEKVEIVEDPARIRPWEIWWLCSCNEKIYSIISARPTISLEESLKRTIQWYTKQGMKWPWE